MKSILKYSILLVLFLSTMTIGLQLHGGGSGSGGESEYHSGGYEHEVHPEETEVHSEIDHKHATSHQSVKFHHFHAVPVYIKKEDQHLLKNPVEVGGSKSKLKIIHPETEHNHNYGAVIENHQESHHHGHYGGGGGHYEHYHHE